MILITYDVNTTTPAGRKRLSQIAKICKNYGQRVQNSVFECDLDNTLFVKVKKMLLDTMDTQQDSLRFYNLGTNYSKCIEHCGVKQSYDPEGTLIL